jgi:type VI protein secretion system component VasF
MKTLPALCEPFFLYVCRLNRIARTGNGADFEIVRTDIKDLFTKMSKDSEATPRLHEQFKRVERPLIFFVDSIISEGKLPFAAAWNDKRLAFEQRVLTGDEAFFNLLDETLADPSDEASERLATFYTCLGMGFSGCYKNQPEYLRKKMREISPRIAGHVNLRNEAEDFITPEAYNYTNKGNLHLQVSASVLPLIVSLVALAILVVVINYMLFSQAFSDVRQSLEDILRRDPATAPATLVSK